MTPGPPTLATDLAIFAPVVALLLYWLTFDLWVIGPARASGRPTITRRVIQLSHAYPALPFLAGLVGGLLAGHFWGQF